jgi:RNA recognition motif-containing protein
MESSRIFVKNLPPTISEADFRKHFSAQGREVTDVKLIPHRRIGFVGYKSHDDALRAVKYFNKTFIRMSRIAVDLAKPVRAPGRPNLQGLLLIIDARLQTRPPGPPQRTSQALLLPPTPFLPSLALQA